MDFQKVTFETDLDQIEDTEKLRGLVREFSDAQEQNIAEFEEISEEFESLETKVGEFKDADAQLTEEVAEKTYLEESEAEALTFSRKQEILEEAEFSEEAEEESDEEEAEFDDMGKRGETHDESAAEADLKAEYLDDIQGLEF
ncbi:MAG: hypothetical protein ABEI86_15210 [Halobacteriaceae archaeon]